MKKTWLVVLACGLSCGPGGKRAKAPEGKPGAGAPVGLRGVDMADFGGAGTDLPVAQVPGRALTADEVQRVLKRLAPLKESEQTEFALRERSLPPPRPGSTVNLAFPPPPPTAAKPAGQDRPLEVVRWAPEGDVPLVPQVSVSFSHPMVEVTSHDDLAKQELPVKLSPQPPGNWRWLGTQTVVFDPRVPRDNRPDDADGAPPQQRLPAATTYTVEIPAGTRSAIGGTLSTGKTFTFQTPTPVLQTRYPTYGPQGLEPILFASFDQAIDPAAVLATISVSGRKGAELRLATAAEIAKDDTVKRLTENAEKGRWLAFRTTQPLPKATTISIVVGPGTPSAEGPRLTDKPQTWSFWTYGPMEIREWGCGWRCGPGQSIYLEFSNPIQEDVFDASKVKISPSIAKLEVASGGSSITLSGRTRARTTYAITVPAGLRDVFGQVLEKDVNVKVRVDPALPAFAGPEQSFMVLDPTAKPRIPIFTVNHKSLKLRVHRVSPDDWQRFRKHMQKHDEDLDDTSLPPGKPVINATVPVAGSPDELVETDVDLSAALPGGVGQLVVVIEPTVKRKRDRWGWRRREEVRAWVQVTRLGVGAFTDSGEMLAWASSLSDGKSLAGVDLELLPKGAKAKSGPDGIAHLPLSEQDTTVLIARKGGDVAMLPKDVGWWGDPAVWVKRNTPESLQWLVFDDRHLYRPDETVHFKGWIRRNQYGKGGSLGAYDSASPKAKWVVRDSRNNEVLKGEVAITATGSFDGSFKLPKTMNLGRSYLTFTAVGAKLSVSSFSHDFQVEEFRRPEFEVSARLVDEGTHYVGDKVRAAVTATYYAGGALPGADVSWRIVQTPTDFVPPGRDEYSFGVWESWWSRRTSPSRDKYSSESGLTDGMGVHTVTTVSEALQPGRPVNVRAEASVMDVNRQSWSASTSYLAHAGDLYVGLKSDRYFVQRGQPILIDAIAADIDGKLVAAPIKLHAYREAWRQVKGSWETYEADVQDCTPTTTTDKPSRCTFQAPEGGDYKIVATVADSKSRQTRSQYDMWVSGGDQPPDRELEQETVTVIPDKKEYQPGDTAELLVQSPFAPAEALITVRRQGLLRSERMLLAKGSGTVKVAIEEAHMPNLTVQVDVVGSAVRRGDDGVPDAKLPRRPAFASGSVDLRVPPRARTLELEVAPKAKEVEPGGETDVTLILRDAAGQPVAGGEIALVVVDESVLALSGYQLPDPLEHFWRARGTDMEDSHLRESVLLAKPEPPEIEVAEPRPRRPMKKAMESMNGSGSGAMGGASFGRASVSAKPAPATGMKYKAGGKDVDDKSTPDTPIAVRQNFDALALFAPSLPTDAQGRATVHVKVPDNLTRYRVMAVAVARDREFGKGDAAITARLPLMVRPSAPRFLNFGDKLQLPVVVQNQTDQPIEVDVAVRGSNLAMIGATTGNAVGRRVTVPARNRVEVRFPAAAVMAGSARFQVGGVSGKWADAAEVALPVWTPATTEAFATYGVVDQGAILQPVKPPSDVYKQFGGLEITTASTELQALTDAVLYLVAYPFECAEQLSSRIMSVAALKDVLAAFQAEGLPPPAELIAAVDRDIKRLSGRQNWDGGFGFWRRGEESWPFTTLHAMHALARARGKGFKVEDDIINRGLGYLRQIERHIPWWYPREARRAIQAYALYTRERLGEPDVKKALGVLDEAPLDDTQMETIAWLYPLMSIGAKRSDADAADRLDKIRRHLMNRVSEEAGTAHWTTDYGDSAYLLLASDRRVDGILLEGIIRDQPESDLIPKVVRGLLAHKVKGRWGSTQENSWVLLAMDLYFHTFEKDTPDFTARAWLGDYFAGEHQFKGRTTERAHIDVPMAVVQESGKKDLTIGKEGQGRLYYRIGMQYAPKNLRLPPSEHGFTVLRVYEAVDQPTDVSRDKDGVWHVKAGARVRVRLTMVAQSRRYHVALVDPLPAGLEPQNAALKTTGSIPDDPKEQAKNKYWYWMMPWYQHQNLRDERVEAFTTLLWEGVHNYSYVARATTPGNFVVPPAKAEEMYMPETFGRSAGDRLMVE